MKLIKIVLGLLENNTYFVCSEQKNAAIIDPSTNSKKIIEKLETEGLTPKMILLTHGHFDHTGAVKELVHYYNIPVYANNLDEELYAPIAVPNQIIGGEKISLDDLSFEVIATPGHTLGSVCFACGDCLFTGDTLFRETIGRTDFPESDPQAMQESLKLFLELDKNYKIYPGHGDESTLDFERKNNPYLN